MMTTKTPSRDLSQCLINAMLASQHVSQRADIVEVAENYLTIALEKWQDELVARSRMGRIVHGDDTGDETDD